MKKKIEFLKGYIKALRCEEFSMTIDIEYSSIEYINYYCKGKKDISVPTNIESIIEEIIENYTDELYDFGPGSTSDSASDYFNANLTYYPESNKLIFNEVTHTEYGTEGSESSYDFDDYKEGDGIYETFMEVRKFLEKEGVEYIKVTYNGGGDSGWIENGYTSKNGSGQINTDIENICYDLLQEFGGWEINEGSQGVITLGKNEIDVEHEWNTEEQYTNKINIEVTPEGFND